MDTFSIQRRCNFKLTSGLKRLIKCSKAIHLKVWFSSVVGSIKFVDILVAGALQLCFSVSSVLVRLAMQMTLLTGRYVDDPRNLNT